MDKGCRDLIHKWSQDVTLMSCTEDVQQPMLGGCKISYANSQTNGGHKHTAPHHKATEELGEYLTVHKLS